MSQNLERTRTSSPQNLFALPNAPTLVLDEELENYFSAPLTYPPTKASSPIHQHLAFIKKELRKPFPSNSTTLARLERSLLKVVESEDAEVPIYLWQACTNITLALFMAILDHQMCKARHDSILRDLEELASLEAQKKQLLGSIPSCNI